MSNIKLNTDLFLGTQELERLVKFLKDDGYERIFDQIIEKYGIVNNPLRDPNFDNLRVIQGSGATNITVKQGFAVDSNGNIIAAVSDKADIASVPTGVVHYVIASYVTTNFEEGTVDITASGQLSGSGTLFTEVLRGQPNFASRIKFPNSTLNTGVYEVVDVNANDDIVIAGSLQVETGQKYVVVGTFTPDRIIPPSNQDIFQYDTIEITVSSTDTSDDQTSFLLATVQTDGFAMTLTDKRTAFLETGAKSEFSNIDDLSTPNALITVENIKFDSSLSDQSKNLVQLSWGFFSLSGSWTINEQTSILTINSGSGGSFANTSEFTDGDFDGWRGYFENGQFVEIISSTRTGVVITCVLRSFNSNIHQSTGDMIIVPNAATINLVFGASQPIASEEYTFPMSMGRAVFELRAGYDYTTTYRYIYGKVATQFQTIVNNDYLDERSFDNDGLQTSSNTSSVSGGVFTTQVATGAITTGAALVAANNTFTGVNIFNNDVRFKDDFLYLNPSEIQADETLTLREGTFFYVNSLGNNLKFINLKGAGSIIWLTFLGDCTIIDQDNTTGGNIHLGDGTSIVSDNISVSKGTTLCLHQMEEGLSGGNVQVETRWKVHVEGALNFTPNETFSVGKKLNSQLDYLRIGNSGNLNSIVHDLKVASTVSLPTTWELPNLSGELVPAPNGISGIQSLDRDDVEYKAYSDSSLNNLIGVIGSSAAVVPYHTYLIYGKMVLITLNIVNLNVTAAGIARMTIEGYPFTFSEYSFSVGRLGSESTGRRASLVTAIKGTNIISVGEIDAATIPQPSQSNEWDTNFSIWATIA